MQGHANLMMMILTRFAIYLRRYQRNQVAEQNASEVMRARPNPNLAA